MERQRRCADGRFGFGEAQQEPIRGAAAQEVEDFPGTPAVEEKIGQRSERVGIARKRKRAPEFALCGGRVARAERHLR